MSRRWLVILALALPCASAWAGGLDDLEMDVLAPGEFPGRAVPRITLPRASLGGEPLRPAMPDLHVGVTLDSTDQVRQSSSVSRDTLEAARDRAGMPGRYEAPALMLEP